MEDEKWPLLGSGSVNTFPQQPTHLTAVIDTNTTIDELLEAMFSVGSEYKILRKNMFPA
jgi:hypothetical protein